VSRTKIKPKRLADFPKAYRDALAYWSAFRQLGFSADDIYFGFGVVDGQPDIVHMQLATQGATFTVTVAQLRGVPRSKVLKTWQQCATLAQESSVEERNQCYREHLIGQSPEYFMLLAVGIQEKGILVPEILSKIPHAGTA
jgi:hypothetical protein